MKEKMQGPVLQGFSEAAGYFAGPQPVLSGLQDVTGEKTEFRESLIAHIAQWGVTSAELAQKTGVSKAQIDKLRQRRVDVTNVHDAMKLAAFFGKSVEEFCTGPKLGVSTARKSSRISASAEALSGNTDHPLWGWAPGTIMVAAGVDLTDPVYSDAEIDDFLNRSAYLIESGARQ